MFAMSLSYLLHFAASVTATVLSDLNLFGLRFFLNLLDSRWFAGLQLGFARSALQAFGLEIMEL